MKKVTSLFVLTAAVAVQVTEAQTTVYSEDFTVDPTFTRPLEDNDGTVNNGPNAVVFRYADADAGNLEEQTVSAGEFFGGTQPGAGEGLLVTTDTGLLVSNGTHGGDRGRGFGVIVDISSFSAGDYTFSFDVGSFTLPNGGAATEEAVGFSAWEGNATGGIANYAEINLGRNNSDGAPLYGLVSGQGTATGARIGDEAIVASGLFSRTYTVSEGGDAGDYLLLQWWVWSESTEPVTTDLPSFTIDNILVTVPEPGTSGLIAGALAMAAVMIRRRR